MNAAPPGQQDRRRPAATGLALAGLFLAGFLVAWRPIADMDFHWHLLMGQAWLDGRLPAEVDPWTHLPTIRPPELGSPLADMLFAGLHRFGGVRLVQVFLAALFGIVLVAAWRLARRLTESAEIAWVIAAVFGMAVIDRVQARPDLFSILGFLLAIDIGWRPPNRWRVPLAFGLGALWINLHPGALLAPVWTALAVIDHGLDRSPRRDQAGKAGAGSATAPALARAVKPAFFAAAAALVGLALSPRGLGYTIVLARDTAVASTIIPEWQPLWRLPSGTFVPQWIVAGGVIATCLSLSLVSRHRMRRGPLWLAVAATVAALSSYRLQFMLVAPCLWAGVVVAASPRWMVHLQSHLGRAGIAAFVVVALINPGAGPLADRWTAAAAAKARGASVVAELHEPNYPLGAARFLLDHDLRGNLFHPPRFGGYLAWALDRRYRIAHDGRITLFDPELARDLQRFVNPVVRPGLVSRFRLQILVLPPDVLPPEEVADVRRPDDPRGRWLAVYADGVATVYVDRTGADWPHNRRALGGS